MLHRKLSSMVKSRFSLNLFATISSAYRSLPSKQTVQSMSFSFWQRPRSTTFDIRNGVLRPFSSKDDESSSDASTSESSSSSSSSSSETSKIYNIYSSTAADEDAGADQEGLKLTEKKEEDFDVPVDYVDDLVEAEKIFNDTMAALEQKDGLKKLTHLKKYDDVGAPVLEWQLNPEEIEALKNDIYAAKSPELIKKIKDDPELQRSDLYLEEEEDEDYENYDEDFDRNDPNLYVPEDSPAGLHSLTDYTKNFRIMDNWTEGNGRVPNEVTNGQMAGPFLNTSLNLRVTDEFPDKELEKFVPRTASERYHHNQQGLRVCVGGKQRRGKKGVLGCHKIDLDALNYLDVPRLRFFLSRQAEILSRKETGLCARCQRKVSRVIKRSRNMGLLPHIGEYNLRDGNTMRRNKPFHESIEKGKDEFDTFSFEDFAIAPREGEQNEELKPITPDYIKSKTVRVP